MENQTHLFVFISIGYIYEIQNYQFYS